VTIINRSAEEVDPKGSSFELSKKIFTNYHNEDPGPVALALTDLKKEVAKFL
jgi:hypothetical protein